MDVIIHVINNPCKSFHQNFHPCNRNHKAAFRDQPLISIAAYAHAYCLFKKNINVPNGTCRVMFNKSFIWMVSIQERVMPGP